jgi:hypothetical protein
MYDPKAMRKRLRNSVSTMISEEEILEYVSHEVNRIWDKTAESNFEPTQYVLRHHLSVLYMRQWAKNLHDETGIKPDLEFVKYSEEGELIGVVDHLSSDFVYDIKDELRYSDRLEAFLSKSVEQWGGDGFKSGNDFINEREKGNKEDLAQNMNSLTKIRLALFITAQWGKSKRMREASPKQNSDLDLNLKNLIINASVHLFKKRWAWIESDCFELTFSADPVQLYPILGKNLASLTGIEVSAEEKEMEYHSFFVSSMCLFAYNKNLLLVIGDTFPGYVHSLVSSQLEDVDTIYCRTEQMRYNGIPSKDLFYLGELAGPWINIHRTKKSKKALRSRLDLLLFAEYNQQIIRYDNSVFTRNSDDTMIPGEVIFFKGFDNNEDFNDFLKEKGQIPKDEGSFRWNRLLD